ncbi:MAG: type 1 glutamine amidotransferase [Alphaproteobacteria bacterium]
MNILVLQHAASEHPGEFRRFLAEDGHEWAPVELDAGETPPPLDGFDALWVMGGPMDVWEEDQHPWLKGEKALIRQAVEGRGMPFLGICLGHQLLACALGGECAKAAAAEIGVLPVRLTGLGAESIFLDDVPAQFPCLQWHGAEVTRLPAGARVLATSPDCAVQAMSWGPRALSMQFHLEIEADTVANWAAIPAYRDALDDTFGPGGADRLAADCAARMAAFNTIAERVYINWLQAAARVG